MIVNLKLDTSRMTYVPNGKTNQRPNGRNLEEFRGAFELRLCRSSTDVGKCRYPVANLGKSTAVIF